MFDLHCHHCNRDYLVGARSIGSLHNTSEGPVAYARCPQGHHVLRQFRHADSAPLPAAHAAA